jgi:ankyrin repeat protein
MLRFIENCFPIPCQDGQVREDDITIMEGESISAEEGVLISNLIKIKNLNPDKACKFLVLAAKRGYLKMAELLIQKGVDINGKDEYGDTPLSCAIRNYHFEIVVFLIEKGVDVNKKYGSGHTALYDAVKNKHCEIAKLLIKKGANVNERIYGYTILFWAVENDHLEVAILLIEKGVDVNGKDKKNSPLLLHAMKNGHLEVAKLLIEKGMNVDEKDEHWRTPLSLAAGGGHLEMVEYLIERGAVVDERDEYGRTPFLYAAKNGHLEVAKLLIEKGAGINEVALGVYTPLYYAATYNHLEMTKFLIQNKAIIDLRHSGPLNDENCTAIKLSVIASMLYQEADYQVPEDKTMARIIELAYIEILRIKWLTFLLGTHKRPGIESVVRMLYVDVLELILKSETSLLPEDLGSFSKFHKTITEDEKLDIVKLICDSVGERGAQKPGNEIEAVEALRISAVDSIAKSFTR